MVTKCMVKIGEIRLFTFIYSLSIPKWIAISPFLFFKRFICDVLATLCVNLVNFGRVSSEFKRVVGVHSILFKEIISFETNYLRIYLTDFYQIFTTW